MELKEIQRLEGHTDRVWSLDWNPATGHAGIPLVFASCSGDKTVRIWEQNLSSGLWSCKVSSQLCSHLPHKKIQFTPSLTIDRNCINLTLCFEHKIITTMKCRRFWKRHKLEPFDLARGHRRENCWQLQASMPPLPFGKMLVVILSVFLLWRYITSDYTINLVFFFFHLDVCIL